MLKKYKKNEPDCVSATVMEFASGASFICSAQPSVTLKIRSLHSSNENEKERKKSKRKMRNTNVSVLLDLQSHLEASIGTQSQRFEEFSPEISEGKLTKLQI